MGGHLGGRQVPGEFSHVGLSSQSKQSVLINQGSGITRVGRLGLKQVWGEGLNASCFLPEKGGRQNS